MKYKYRILEDGNGKFLIQRGIFFIWQYLMSWHDWDYSIRNAERFNSKENALEWLNKYNKREQERKKDERNSKTVVKCTTLVPDENDL